MYAVTEIFGRSYLFGIALNLALIPAANFLADLFGVSRRPAPSRRRSSASFEGRCAAPRTRFFLKVITEHLMLGSAQPPFKGFVKVGDVAELGAAGQFSRWVGNHDILVVPPQWDDPGVATSAGILAGRSAITSGATGSSPACGKSAIRRRQRTLPRLPEAEIARIQDQGGRRRDLCPIGRGGAGSGGRRRARQPLKRNRRFGRAALEIFGRGPVSERLDHLELLRSRAHCRHPCRPLPRSADPGRGRQLGAFRSAARGCPSSR